MTAYINHGRWIVDCPNPACRSALLAHETRCDCGDQTVCEHRGECNTPITATYPPDAEGIWTILERRPREHRNWTTETLEALKAENLEHGVKI
jgi:hypothetical protein